MRVHIIGSGWLAQPLARLLQSAGHELLLTTTKPEKAAQLNTQGLPAMVYQLGAQANHELLDCDVLVIAITSKDLTGLTQLFQQLSQTDTQVIYISSTSVYANQNATADSAAHTEASQRLNQASPILQIEQALRDNIPQATVVRFAGLVGPQRHPGRFFRHGKTIKNPQAPVNLIHLADCIGIINAIIEQNVRGEIFNACADTHPSKATFYPLMAKQLGLPAPDFESSPDGSHKRISNHKVKAMLGYQFKYPDVMDMPF